MFSSVQSCFLETGKGTSCSLANLYNKATIPNRATWKRVNQSEHYLRTTDSDLFLKQTNNIEEYKQQFLTKLKI